MKFLICLFVFVVALGGCAQVPVSHAEALNAWVKQQGGELNDHRLARVQAVGQRLGAPSAGGHISFHVVRASAVAAYSWDEGEIFLTAGLVDLATDDEIAAAIAHEMGHLMMAGGGDHAALRGGGSPLDIERRADALGVGLLKSAGHPPGALISLLSKVSAAGGPGVSQSDLRTRIKALQSLTY